VVVFSAGGGILSRWWSQQVVVFSAGGGGLSRWWYSQQVVVFSAGGGILSRSQSQQVVVFYSFGVLQHSVPVSSKEQSKDLPIKVPAKTLPAPRVNGLKGL